MPILLAPALFIILGISGKVVFKSFPLRNSLYFNSWVTSAFWTKAEFICDGRYLEIKPVKIENNVRYKSKSNCNLQLHLKLYCMILVITYTAPLGVIIGCRMDLIVPKKGFLKGPPSPFEKLVWMSSMVSQNPNNTIAENFSCESDEGPKEMSGFQQLGARWSDTLLKKLMK